MYSQVQRFGDNFIKMVKSNVSSRTRNSLARARYKEEEAQLINQPKSASIGPTLKSCGLAIRPSCLDDQDSTVDC
jgi:hypothetical protein